MHKPLHGRWLGRPVAGAALFAALLVALSATAHGVTLVNTGAGVLDSAHPQVATIGGRQAHLVRVVTATDAVDAAIDADVLLADGSPLVLTWRREPGDADLVDLSLALVIDSAPRHLELRLRSLGGGELAFAQLGDVSTSGMVQAAAPARVVITLDDAVEPLEDLALGAPAGGVALADGLAWRIDLTGLAAWETFDLVLRAGPPGDLDDDDDVDLDDYAAFADCLEAAELSDTCEWFFDFDADRTIDLRDFAVIQVVYTGPAELQREAK